MFIVIHQKKEGKTFLFAKKILQEGINYRRSNVQGDKVHKGATSKAIDMNNNGHDRNYCASGEKKKEEKGDHYLFLEQPFDKSGTICE